MKLTITRRQFNQVAMGLGLTWTAGGLLAGCGDDDDLKFQSGTPPPSQTETKTFHFDLSALPLDDAHVLRASGRRYPLQRHTAETRRAARRANPGLIRVPDDHLTHFAEDVVVSALHQQRIHVTTFNAQRGHGLALVAMHIPTAARLKARTARGLAGQTPAGTALGSADCTIEDQVEDDFLTGRSTAKSMITHYPDILNLDPDAAATVESHMDGDQAAAVDNLTLSICAQGPAYEHDPAYLDGWAVLVPQLNEDGSPILDSAGNPTYDYVFSDQTNQDLPPAVAAIVQSIKNDPTLEDKSYTVIYHGDPVDTDSLPEANVTPLVAEQSALVAAAPGSSGESVDFSTLGYHHNILFYDPKHSSTDRQFSLRIMNLNFIWYSLYLEYLDADGKPMNASGSGVLDGVLSGVKLESDTLVFWDMISSPPAIFGVPIPFPYQMTLTLPDGASQVRLNLIGPGMYGSLPYGPAVIPGVVLTAIIQFALPMFFLTKGTGIDSTASLTELILNKPGVWVKTLSEGYQIFSDVMGTNTNDLGIEASLASLFATVVENILLIPLERFSPELWEWVTEEFTKEEIEDGVPFVGWIIRAVAIAGTAGAMLASDAEISTNPVTISNTVSFTNSVTVVVSHDPEDFEFPLDATHFQVQITAGTKALEPPTVVPISNEDRSKDTLTAVVANVPSTGAEATVTVIFMADNGYPLAHSAAVDVNGNPVLDENGDRVPGDVSFLNKLPPSGELVVNVPIIENPVPITAQTQYTHHHKLQYANGKYNWNYTPTPPALEQLNCGAGGLCDLGNVTIWVPGGMIGYSWLANSPSVKDCVTTAQGQLYNFKNLSLKNDPNTAVKTPGCGFPGATPLSYDATATVPAGASGYHFYLDPVRISDLDPEYHLRRITLDNTTPIAVNTNESWGRFRIALDRIAVYSKGTAPRVVGISSRFHKFAILEVPTTAYIGDDFSNNAKVMAGAGEGNDELLLSPRALTIADNGAILILQGGTNKSIKAFDFDGKPWKFFSGGTASVLPLAQDATEVTWLDISIDPTNLLYVLSYSGAGTKQSDFRLDVYDANAGTRIVRNTGIAVGRIVVDKFRGLYSLNYETVKGSPIVEPSVSVWAPSVPAAALVVG